MTATMANATGTCRIFAAVSTLIRRGASAGSRLMSLTNTSVVPKSTSQSAVARMPNTSEVRPNVTLPELRMISPAIANRLREIRSLPAICAAEFLTTLQPRYWTWLDETGRLTAGGLRLLYAPVATCCITRRVVIGRGPQMVDRMAIIMPAMSQKTLRMLLNRSEKLKNPVHDKRQHCRETRRIHGEQRLGFLTRRS